jgi:cytochrome c-type biogenesis protein CcmE
VAGTGARVAGRANHVVARLLIVAAAVFLIASSTRSTAHFFLTIEELLALRDAGAGRNLTASGAVLGDTIAYDASTPRVSFTRVQLRGDPKAVERAAGLASVLHAAAGNPDAPRLEIVCDGVPPDLLRHKAQAIVRARLGDDGQFHADEILLECPSRYEEQVPQQSENT